MKRGAEASSEQLREEEEAEQPKAEQPKAEQPKASTVKPKAPPLGFTVDASGRLVAWQPQEQDQERAK